MVCVCCVVFTSFVCIDVLYFVVRDFVCSGLSLFVVFVMIVFYVFLCVWVFVSVL